MSLAEAEQQAGGSSAEQLRTWAALTGLLVNVDMHSSPHNRGLKAANVVVQFMGSVQPIDAPELEDVREAGIVAATWKFKPAQLMLLSYYRDQVEHQADAISSDPETLSTDIIFERNVNPIRNVFAEDDVNTPFMLDVANLTGQNVVLHIMKAGSTAFSARYKPGITEDLRRESYIYTAVRAPLDPLHAYFNEVNGIAV